MNGVMFSSWEGTKRKMLPGLLPPHLHTANTPKTVGGKG